jgi:MFS family permease
MIFPETSREIVENGSLPARLANRVPLPILVPTHSRDFSRSPRRRTPGKKFPNPATSLKLLRSHETATVLLAYGITYSVILCLQASLSTIFLEIYHISGFVAGMIYLPFGVGCVIASLVTGKVLDRDYKRTAGECGIVIDNGRGDDLRSFPIERARLRSVKFCVAASVIFLIGYGWLLRGRVHMAAPLLMQFFLGLTIPPLFTALNTLIADIHPGCPSTAQAACNLVRCELAAAFLAALDAMLRYFGVGWCFVLLGGLIALVVPMLILLETKGLGWRKSRFPEESSIVDDRVMHNSVVVPEK